MLSNCLIEHMYARIQKDRFVDKSFDPKILYRVVPYNSYVAGENLLLHDGILPYRTRSLYDVLLPCYTLLPYNTTPLGTVPLP